MVNLDQWDFKSCGEEERKKYIYFKTAFLHENEAFFHQFLEGNFVGQDFGKGLAKANFGNYIQKTVMGEVEFPLVNPISNYQYKMNIEFARYDTYFDNHIELSMWPKPAINIEFWDWKGNYDVGDRIDNYSADFKYSAFLAYGGEEEYTCSIRKRYIEEIPTGQKLFERFRNMIEPFCK
ncbi:MAG: hypothetical protein ABJO86_14415 [Lentilitoribacter sp.]